MVREAMFFACPSFHRFFSLVLVDDFCRHVLQNVLGCTYTHSPNIVEFISFLSGWTGEWKFIQIRSITGKNDELFHFSKSIKIQY